MIEGTVQQVGSFEASSEKAAGGGGPRRKEKVEEQDEEKQETRAQTHTYTRAYIYIPVGLFIVTRTYGDRFRN